MEDTLWVCAEKGLTEMPLVLILILMEDTLWVDLGQINAMLELGLNPYSNGRYSMSGLTIYDPAQGSPS